MPVGGILVSDRIASTLARTGGFIHGFTFSHNPVTAAACLRTLEILEEEQLVERAARMGDTLFELLDPIRRHPHVGDVRGRGLMAGIEIVADTRTRRPFARVSKTAEAVAKRAFEHGVILYPSSGFAAGTDGDVVMIAPPFVVTEGELQEIVSVLDRTLFELGL
jgi:adenosylmethionine-8-amino-7-oxononanoate aminotransferase